VVELRHLAAVDMITDSQQGHTTRSIAMITAMAPVSWFSGNGHQNYTINNAVATIAPTVACEVDWRQTT